MKLTSSFWQIVKKANQNLFPVLLGLILLTSAAMGKTLAHAPNETGAANPQVLVEPSATFQRLWIDYDVTEGGRSGMRVHVQFKVYNMKGIPGYLALYFQERDGTALQDNNDKFNSADDTVAVYREIAPGFATTVYEDLQTFMPYSELDLEDGDYDLRIDADVIYKEGGLVQHLTFYDFVYNQGDKNTPTAEFGRVWVDYDIMQGGVKGMRIHAKFTVVDMKGVAGYLAVYFEKKNGDKLYSNNKAYRSKEGQLAVYFDMNPGFQRTVYEDAQLFIPYSEFTLARGTYDLKMDIDVIYENGDLIQHLTWHDFVFYKK